MTLLTLMLAEIPLPLNIYTFTLVLGLTIVFPPPLLTLSFLFPSLLCVPSAHHAIQSFRFLQVVRMLQTEAEIMQRVLMHRIPL